MVSTQIARSYGLDIIPIIIIDFIIIIIHVIIIIIIIFIIYIIFIIIIIIIIITLFPMTPHYRQLVSLLVGWLVGLSYCNKSLKGQEVELLCSYPSTRY